MAVSFKTSKCEAEMIGRIVTRAFELCKTSDIKCSRTDWAMDITACHCNGCVLDLAKLAESPDADFGHDVFGIRKFLDRSTGKLTGNFDPRCAAAEKAVARG